jgi:hypothetical protein
MDGAARRRRMSLGRVAVVGTTDFVRGYALVRAFGLCHARGAACQAVVRLGLVVARAGPAVCILMADRDRGHVACGRIAAGQLRTVDLAVVIPAVAEAIAVTSAVTNTL